jgi:hypothetical protein
MVVDSLRVLIRRSVKGQREWWNGTERCAELGVK